MLQAVWVLAVASICRAAGRLNIGAIPWFWPERAQDCRGMQCPCTDLSIEGLQDHTALLGPIGLESQNEPLEGERRVSLCGHKPRSREISKKRNHDMRDESRGSSNAFFIPSPYSFQK